jgi:hypothetical protein
MSGRSMAKRLVAVASALLGALVLESAVMAKRPSEYIKFAYSPGADDTAVRHTNRVTPAWAETEFLIFGLLGKLERARRIAQAIKVHLAGRINRGKQSSTRVRSGSPAIESPFSRGIRTADSSRGSGRKDLARHVAATAIPSCA